MSSGQKPRYRTPEELQVKIQEYMELCTPQPLKDAEGNLLLSKEGNPIYGKARRPTVTGLALHLGFTSRQALLNYQGRPAFVDTVTRAKSWVEEYLEQCLTDPEQKPQGAIFALKQHGWKDSVDVNQTGGAINITFEVGFERARGLESEGNESPDPVS